MQFLYKKEFEDLNLTNCPPSDYIPRLIDNAFRWVYDDIEDSRNFLPQFHKNPKRFLGKSEALICSSLALSMFDSANNAEIRFNELKEVLKEKAYSALGTKIAVGKITEKDGTNSEIDEIGHFNHHLVAQAHYTKQFKIIKTL